MRDSNAELCPFFKAASKLPQICLQAAISFQVGFIIVILIFFCFKYTVIVMENHVHTLFLMCDTEDRK